MSNPLPIAADPAAQGSLVSASATSGRAPLSSWFALAMLVVATVLGSIDRIVLTLLTEPMRHTLALSDTQLGLLQGAGLILFAGLATLPLGWLSDRYDRRVVLAACVVLWSAATALRGTAMNYSVLFIASIGLGVGEAGLAPIINSLIPDLFARGQRVLANAVFALAAMLGGSVGAMLGGAIVNLMDSTRHLLPASMQALETWRLTFFAMAVAGLPVALLVLSIRARRDAPAAASGVPDSATGSPATAGYGEYVRRNWRVLTGLVAGIGLASIGLSAIVNWIPIAAARQFGVTPADLGQRVGLAFLAGTIVGGIFGVAALRIVQRRVGTAAALRVIMLCNFAAALLSIPLLFVRSSTDMFVLLALLVAPLISSTVLLPNVMQDVSPPHLRARIIATMTMASLPFGVLGPLVVGLVSDAVSSLPNGLVVAVVATTLVCGAIGALVLWTTERPFVRLLQMLRSSP